VRALDAYKAAQTHSALAASEDKKWAGLNLAYGNLVTEWTALVAAGDLAYKAPQADQVQEFGALIRHGPAGAQAAKVIQSDCASANSQAAR
jgi:hypothetical protein